MAARVRQLLALRPDAGSSRRSPSGHDRGAGPHARGPRRRPAPPGARRRGCACPSGNTNRMWPSSRIRWASRNASTSAAPRSTGWTPPFAAAQPTIGQSNSSFLPSQWIRRPSLRDQPRAEDDRVEVRGVVRGEDHGPSRGISSIAPSIAIRLIARPKIRPPSGQASRSAA